jgi:hypothetical protein
LLIDEIKNGAVELLIHRKSYPQVYPQAVDDEEGYPQPTERIAM